jgi:hypothetical protein
MLPRGHFVHVRPSHVYRTSIARRSLNHLQSVRQRIDEDSTETTKWQQRYPISMMKKSVSGTCELDVHGALRDGIARHLDDETIGRLGLGTPAR